MTKKINIEIDNLTDAQAMAIEDMLKQWVYLGNIGASRWTAFFADGDGNFRPKILVNGQEPKYAGVVPTKFPANYDDDKNIWKNVQIEQKPNINNGLTEIQWHKEYEMYMMDFDSIAWKLDNQK